MGDFLTYYTVTLQAPTGQTAPSDGFVDNTKVEVYLAQNDPNGFTYAESQAKRRANRRYDFIVAQLGLMANCYVLAVTAPGATATTAPTSFAMLLQVERGDPSLVTADELNPGLFVTGAAAIARCVARGIMLTFDDIADVYDPTLAGTIGNTAQFARTVVRTDFLPLTPYSGNLAAAQATVTVAPVVF